MSRVVFFIVFLVCPLLSRGQLQMMLGNTGAAAFVPCPNGECADLVGWWRAEDYDGDHDPSNNTAGTKNVWVDLSSNGRNLTAPLAANQPSIVLNSLNGKASFSFGADDVLATGAISALNGISTYTVYIVMRKQNQTGTRTALLIKHIDHTSSAWMYTTSATNLRWLTNTAALTPKTVDIATVAGTDYYVTAIWRTNDNTQMWVNGVAGTEITGATMNPTTHQNITVGGHDPSANYFNGTIYEVAIYKTEHTDAKRIALQNFFKNYYGL